MLTALLPSSSAPISRSRASTMVREEAFPDPGEGEEGGLAGFHLLALRDQPHQATRGDLQAGHVADACRQPDRRKMMRHATGIVPRDEAKTRRELERAGG